MIRVPVDKPLEIQRDISRGHFLGDRHVVTGWDRGTAIAFGQPVLIELDVDVSVRRPHGTDVPRVVAERLTIRIRSAAVLCLEAFRTVAARKEVVVEVDRVHLDERRHDRAGYVGDRARWMEGPLARHTAVRGGHLVSAARERLRRIGGPQDLGYGDQICGTRYIGIPRRQPACDNRTLIQNWRGWAARRGSNSGSEVRRDSE